MQIIYLQLGIFNADKYMLKIHPRFLSDSQLRGLWREALYGQKQILAGNSWKNFELSSQPLKSVGAYLSFIASEGLGRGFKMNHELIVKPNFDEEQLTVAYHDLQNESRQLNLPAANRLFCNPVFKIIH